MKAAKLYGPRNIRVVDVPEPRAPEGGEVIVRVRAVGICGSDLHTFEDARIGDTVVNEPLILGHEFAGEIAAAGPDARDGEHNSLKVGQRVTVDPATPCWHCDMCEQGHPNLCRNLTFMGLYPHEGATQEYKLCQGRNCYPFPDNLSADAGALLEPLGLAVHATDLGHLKLSASVAVLGCGPVGLLVMQLAKLSGAYPVYVFDKLDWRLEAAKRWGADHVIDSSKVDPVAALKKMTGGRGVRAAFEVAWAGDAARQAVEMADLGGRVVFVGIPGDDQIGFRHSAARRKGLTLAMCRRMKHTYPRAISLATRGLFDLEDLISHRFELADIAKAYALNAHYEDRAIKVMVEL